jgi:NADPH-dependent curcumin reductase CurA
MRISDVNAIPTQHGTQKWAWDPSVIDAEQQLFDVAQPYYGTYLPQAKMLGQPEYLQPAVPSVFGIGRHHGATKAAHGHHKLPGFPQQTMFGQQEIESWTINPEEPILTAEGLGALNLTSSPNLTLLLGALGASGIGAYLVYYGINKRKQGAYIAGEILHVLGFAGVFLSFTAATS